MLGRRNKKARGKREMPVTTATVNTAEVGGSVHAGKQSLIKGEETGLSVLTIRAQGHKAREMLKKKEANSGKIPKQKRT